MIFCILGNFPSGKFLSLVSLIKLLLLCSLLVILRGSCGLSRYTDTQAHFFPPINDSYGTFPLKISSESAPAAFVLYLTK